MTLNHLGVSKVSMANGNPLAETTNARLGFQTGALATQAAN